MGRPELKGPMRKGPELKAESRKGGAASARHRRQPASPNKEVEEDWWKMPEPPPAMAARASSVSSCTMSSASLPESPWLMEASISAEGAAPALASSQAWAAASGSSRLWRRANPSKSAELLAAARAWRSAESLRASSCSWAKGSRDIRTGAEGLKVPVVLQKRGRTYLIILGAWNAPVIPGQVRLAAAIPRRASIPPAGSLPWGCGEENLVLVSWDGRKPPLRLLQRVHGMTAPTG